MLPLCGEIALVRGLVSSAVWGSPNDETAIGLFEFASGATAELLSSVSFESETRVEVFGDRGSAIAENALGATGAGRIRVNGHTLDSPALDPYVGEIEQFAVCVTGRSQPAVNAIEGLRNVQILEEIVSSGRTAAVSDTA
jgi:predicted dehydrogenase